MNLEILISCMNAKDFSIVERTNVRTNALIVNQIIQPEASPHAFESFVMQSYDTQEGNHIRKIDTNTKGLSVSRNIAVKHANGDLCLLCDDDEYLDDDCESKILHAYEKYRNADIICFHINNLPSRLKQIPQHLDQWTVLRICSVQISFKRESIIKAGIWFDEILGAGTGNGAGEEVKFLRDCVNAGLHLYYVPDTIGTVKQESSTWFKGFDQDFFYKRGMTNRYILGPIGAVLYAVYYSIAKRKFYEDRMTIWQSFYYTMQGIIANDIGKEKRLKREENAKSK